MSRPPSLNDNLRKVWPPFNATEQSGVWLIVGVSALTSALARILVHSHDVVPFLQDQAASFLLSAGVIFALSLLDLIFYQAGFTASPLGRLLRMCALALAEAPLPFQAARESAEIRAACRASSGNFQEGPKPSPWKLPLILVPRQCPIVGGIGNHPPLRTILIPVTTTHHTINIVTIIIIIIIITTMIILVVGVVVFTLLINIICTIIDALPLVDVLTKKMTLVSVQCFIDRAPAIATNHRVTTMTDEEFSGILENFFRKGATWTLYRAYRALSDSVDIDFASGGGNRLRFVAAVKLLITGRLHFTASLSSRGCDQLRLGTCLSTAAALPAQAAVDFASDRLYDCRGGYRLHFVTGSDQLYIAQVAIDFTSSPVRASSTSAQVAIYFTSVLVGQHFSGICSQKSLKLNKSVMLAVASVLCPQSKHKLGLNVGPLKKEAKRLRHDLSMEDDPASVHCEGHAIKGFQTLINRRLFTSRKKRDPTLDDLYAVYRQHWTPTAEEIEKEVESKAGQEAEECDYEEEGGEEEEALEDDVYLDVDSAPPSGMVSSYLDSTLFNSHLSPVKPRKQIADRKAAAAPAPAAQGILMGPINPVEEETQVPSPAASSGKGRGASIVGKVVEPEAEPCLPATNPELKDDGLKEPAPKIGEQPELKEPAEQAVPARESSQPEAKAKPNESQAAAKEPAEPAVQPEAQAKPDEFPASSQAEANKSVVPALPVNQLDPLPEAAHAAEAEAEASDASELDLFDAQVGDAAAAVDVEPAVDVEDKEPRPIATPQTKPFKASPEIAAEKPSKNGRLSMPSEEKPSKRPRLSQVKLQDASEKPRTSKGAATGGKQTFAKRNCPKEGQQGREKWLALREVFESELAHRFRFPSKYEVLLLPAVTMKWLFLSVLDQFVCLLPMKAEEQAADVSEMLKQIDEPLFPVIAVDSSPATPVPSPPKTQRSIVRRMIETEEEGTIEDEALAMDWGKVDMQGSESSAPAAAQSGPSLEGLDKKTLQMTARVTMLHDELQKEDAAMNKIYEKGMVDGYDGECLTSQLLDPRARTVINTSAKKEVAVETPPNRKRTGGEADSPRPKAKAKAKAKAKGKAKAKAAAHKD
ncbi:unnamed protein product [Symbiodinium microadriaticum]|nr:unnamed protein product [Symbiodinium microadriaticum]